MRWIGGIFTKWRADAGSPAYPRRSCVVGICERDLSLRCLGSCNDTHDRRRDSRCLTFRDPHFGLPVSAVFFAKRKPYVNRKAVRSSSKYSCINVSTSLTIPSTTWILLIYSYVGRNISANVPEFERKRTLECGPYPCPVVSRPKRCKKNIVCRDLNRRSNAASVFPRSSKALKLSRTK
jgi:hypothetical protein